MSLPLSRRIARAALLVGAAAAPLVGAGTASAAAAPQGPELGGLTTVDSAGVTGALSGAAQRAGDTAADVGGRAVRTTVPAVGRGAGGMGNAAVPAAQQNLGRAAGAATGLVGTTARTARRAAPAVGPLPVGAEQLPVGELPVG